MQRSVLEVWKDTEYRFRSGRSLRGTENVIFIIQLSSDFPQYLKQCSCETFHQLTWHKAE